MVKRYKADGMVLVGAYYDGQFQIHLCPQEDPDGTKAQPLGSGPSLVEALDDALQHAIIVEEEWRKRLGG